MPRKRLQAWLGSAALCAVAVVQAGVFFAHGQPVAAVVVLCVLTAIAWLLSPAAFPRRRDGAGVVVYWRPGCAYCLRLRWLLGPLARRATWVDIWADEAAAAFVRGVNDGNETVPTVVVADAVRTNPDVRWVRRALRAR